MAEIVKRIRGGGRDEDDRPLPGGDPVPLRATSVAPGSSAVNRDRGRNGMKVAYTVLFYPRVDLKDGDVLVVRGTHCQIVVLDWRSPYTGRKGLEVLCSAGKG